MKKRNIKFTTLSPSKKNVANIDQIFKPRFKVIAFKNNKYATSLICLKIHVVISEVFHYRDLCCHWI